MIVEYMDFVLTKYICEEWKGFMHIEDEEYWENIVG